MSRSDRCTGPGRPWSALLALTLSIPIAGSAFAQTHPAPQSLPYSQDFSALAHGSTTYPDGWQGWINGGPPGISYLTSGPTGDTPLIASSSASNSTGGIHNYDGKIGPVDNSTSDFGVALAINTTGWSGVEVSYDVMTIRNPYNGSSNTRINEFSLQYRVGTSGSWTTLLSTAYDNNTTTQTGSGVTTPQKLESRTVTLPPDCDNQPEVQLRWAQFGSGVGARPGFAVDNILVQQPALDPATVSAVSPAGVITPANPTRTIPVTISRTGSEPLRAFSVEIELASLELAGTPAASITEGAFLSDTGSPTSFQLIDEGGGKYRVDGAILGSTPACGSSALSGTLFNVEVASSVADGTGTLTVTDVLLSDCDNDPLPSTIGTAASVPIDNSAPAVAVVAPNGGEVWPVGSSQDLQWTATDAAGIASIDLAYSTDGGATFPHVIATGEANDGSYAWAVPNTPGTNAIVRVTAHDANGNTASDASDAAFAIVRLTLTVTLAGTGSGVVNKNPDQPDYGFGESVELTAVPAVGSTFTGWSGDASGVTNPLNVALNSNLAITATFTLNAYTLSVATVGSGTVAKVPDQPSYDHGTVVQLTATAATGWHFVGWSGDASGSTNPLNVTMDADRSITATFAANTIVISQVYGGGGNVGSTYTHDFIELFNRGLDPIDITGWTVQYSPASGTGWTTTALSGVIPPGRYYLVQQAVGAGGTTPLPTPDAIGGIAMSANQGKVALVNGAAPLSGACPSGAAIEDLIGYGAANCSETSPAAALTNTTAARRNSGGCDDTDHNAADVTAGAPTPRNSTTPANDCLFTLAVFANPPAAGSVAKSPDLPGYTHGSLVQLTATAVSGYHFSHWSGDASGTTNPLNVTMDDDQSITANFAPNSAIGELVISQVYGGGGNSGATYKNDFIELFNRGNAPVNVTGWTVQYASATGGTWVATPLSGTIPPGRYYLVQEAQGAGGTVNLPTPDAIGGITMNSSDGKVALVKDGVLLSGSCPGSANVVDLLGYGAANCSETSAAPAIGNAIASFRNNGGCDETNDNSADFSNGAPAPRNSATPFHLCPMWVDAEPSAALEFVLAPPVPNPSHGITRIPFALPVTASVRLDVLDLQGRRVVRLVDGVMSAGRHEATWDGTDGGARARPGLYFIRLEVRGKNWIQTVALMR